MNRIIVTVALAGAAGCGGTPDVGDPDVRRGEALFEEAAVSPSAGNPWSCADCHARPGEPGVRLLPGADLGGVAQRGSYWGGQETDLLRAINQCRTYFMRAPEPWSPEDDDALALGAYLAALEGSAEPVAFTPVREIVPPPCEAADPERGSRIFDQACRHCHGTASEGAGRKADAAPVLPDQVLREHGLVGPCDFPTQLDAAASVFASKVRHGVFFTEGGTMPPFSREVLAETDLADLFAFLGVGASR